MGKLEMTIFIDAELTSLRTCDHFWRQLLQPWTPSKIRSMWPPPPPSSANARQCAMTCEFLKRGAFARSRTFESCPNIHLPWLFRVCQGWFRFIPLSRWDPATFSGVLQPLRLQLRHCGRGLPGVNRLISLWRHQLASYLYRVNIIGERQAVFILFTLSHINGVNAN